MRASLRSFIVILTVLTVAACADEPPPLPSFETTDDPSYGVAIALPNDAPLPSPPPRTDVTGIVVTVPESPAGARLVSVVDARGERHETMTDDSGSFSIGNVEPPYDLTVAPTSGFSEVPIVYLGLHQAKLYVELNERAEPSPTAPEQTLRVGVRGCSRGDTVMVTTTSAYGEGQAMTDCNASTAPTMLDVPHRWRAIWIASSELVDVHVLVTNAARTSFSYGSSLGIPASPGAMSAVGVVAPSHVEATEALTIGAKDNAATAALSDWNWTTEVIVDTMTTTTTTTTAAAKTGFVLATTSASSTKMRLPIVPGWTTRVAVSATHPRFDSHGGFQRSTRAWSGAWPIPANSAMTLTVPLGPEIVRPEADGTFSARGRGFRWKNENPTTTPSLATLTVADTVRGEVRFRVLTNDEEIRLARLDVLGIAKLLQGNHVLELTTSRGVKVDDVVSPDVDARRRPLDVTRAGASTHLRASFQVTR